MSDKITITVEKKKVILECTRRVEGLNAKQIIELRESGGDKLQDTFILDRNMLLFLKENRIGSPLILERRGWKLSRDDVWRVFDAELELEKKLGLKLV